MPMIDLDNYTPAYAREHWGTQLDQYTPPADSVIIDIDVDFVTRPITPPIHLVQYDKVLPVLAIHMYSNRSAYTMPQQSTAAIRVNNGNDTYYYAFAEGRSADFTTVYFVLQAPLCISPGFKPGVIEISNSEGIVNSSPISIQVEQNPMPEEAIHTDEDYINLINIIHGVEKWAYGDCQHLTNNSWIVKGCKDGVQIGTGATAEGAENTATGAYSHCEGYNNTSSGARSHAEGNNNTVSGSSGHVEGYENASVGDGAHAEGAYTSTNGIGAHAEGFNTHATAQGAHAEGSGNTSGGVVTASGLGSHAEGFITAATAQGAHAEGSETTAAALYSHVEGKWSSTISSEDGEAPHAEGYCTQAKGRGAHAEGYGKSGSNAEFTKAFSSGAHAEGFVTMASADCAHAEGYRTTASGPYSHAEGNGTVASGQASHASGTASVAGHQDQFVIGRYNENSTGTLFEIGGGTESSRKTIFSVLQNGTILSRRKHVHLIPEEDDLEYSLDQVLETLAFNMYHSFPAYEAPSALTVALTPTASIPAGSYGTFEGSIDIPFSTFDKGCLTMFADDNSMGFTVENFEVNEWVNVSTGSDRDIVLLTTNYERTVETAGVIHLAITCNVHNNSTKSVPTTVELRMSLNCAVMYMLKQS